MLNFEFPVYTTHNDGLHYVKHISPFNCVVVAPWRIEEHDLGSSNLYTHFFDEIMNNDHGIKGITELDNLTFLVAKITSFIEIWNSLCSFITFNFFNHLH